MVEDEIEREDEAADDPRQNETVRYVEEFVRIATTRPMVGLFYDEYGELQFAGNTPGIGADRLLMTLEVAKQKLMIDVVSEMAEKAQARRPKLYVGR